MLIIIILAAPAQVVTPVQNVEPIKNIDTKKLEPPKQVIGGFNRGARGNGPGFLRRDSPLRPATKASSPPRRSGN